MAAADRDMRKALRNLIAVHPFFGALALRMPLVNDPSKKTIACDGERIFYNAAWVEQQIGDTLKAAVARCVMACALKHHTRRGDRDYGRWQQASKIVTLPILQDAGLGVDQQVLNELQSGLALALGDKEMSVEAVYELIPESTDHDESENQQPGQGAAGGSGAGAQGQGDQPDSGEQGEGDGGGDSADHQQDGQGGGQSQGPKGQTPESQDSNGTGEILDAPQAPAQSQADYDAGLKEEEQKWDEAGQQAIQIARAQGEGRTPGMAAELIDNAHGGKVDWRTELRRFMTANVRTDYSWSRPNRRFIAMDLYLPSLRSEGMPPVVLAIDTSASLDEEQLAVLWGEMRSAVADVEPAAVTVIQCDTRVTEMETYHHTDMPVELEAKGRGGTQFSPVFEAIREMDVQPACVIYFTDLGSSDFGEDPGIPVLWALQREAWGYGGGSREVPFGEVIEL